MEKWLTPPLVLSALAVIITIANSYYTRKRDKESDWRKDVEKLAIDLREACKTLDAVEADLKVVQKQIDLFWGTVERRMAKKFGDEE